MYVPDTNELLSMPSSSHILLHSPWKEGQGLPSHGVNTGGS